jgi:hypothetical protein
MMPDHARHGLHYLRDSGHVHGDGASSSDTMDGPLMLEGGWRWLV